jgi:shikimate kinase
MKPQTVSLIGMPGAGKSSVGVLLAKILGLSFLDTDLVIQVRHEATLQEILEAQGYLALRALEEEVLLQVPLESTLVSTGGSVVYSEPAMQRLATAGPRVFIDVPLPVLRQRVDNEAQRGIACAPGQSFIDLFRERQALYHQYASITVDGASQSVEATARLIARQLLQS